MREIVRQYGLMNAEVTPFGNGLINNTWKVAADGKDFILQKINKAVFKNPEAIAANINLLADYLNVHSPEYLFVKPVMAIDSGHMLTLNNEYYRLFSFIENSHSIDIVVTPEQAYEAAKQFGRFAQQLAGFDANKLAITLPDFTTALADGNVERIMQSADLISYLVSQKNIVDEFEAAKKVMKLRVTHHDTKISNVLFDNNDKGICVIDLDTVMPGYFISDVGDMLRTYLSPVNEEEKDFSKIEIRRAFYEAVYNGYMSEMGSELSTAEKGYFLFAGKLMVYMQALRFLTDYFNNDIYYGCKYEGHNFIRAGNQAVLLQRLNEFNPHSD
jgi:Ser/Thr protein kinase RdoA (MazF antagonist)